MTKIDIVVPVRNEALNLQPFVDQVEGLTFANGVDHRILFVEDSSTDNTVQVLRDLVAVNSNVAFVSIDNPYGQGHATYFGVGLADGDGIITMDVDGSHPITAIPDLIDNFLDGAGIVQCVRNKVDGRNVVRNMGTTGFEIATRLITGYDITWQNVHYRLMEKTLSRRVFNNARYWRTGRFRLPKEDNINLVTVPVDCRGRTLGESKFNVTRLASIAFDTILSLITPARLILLVVAAVISFLIALQVSSVLAAIIAVVGLFFLGRYFYILSGHSKSYITVIESKNLDVR